MMHLFIHGRISKTNGSALFAVLIAVALFAALSWAVTKSGQGGGASIQKEQAEIIAARILQNAGMMQYAVQRMMLLNGCADTEINFRAPNGTFNNPSTRPDGSCHMFSAQGGGVSWDKIGDEGNPFFTGSVRVLDVGTEATELMYFEYMSEDLGPAVCRAILKKLWNALPPSNQGVTSATPFQGVFAATPTATIGNAGTAGGFFAGKHAGCFGSHLVPNHHFYFVLLPR